MPPPKPAPIVPLPGSRHWQTRYQGNLTDGVSECMFVSWDEFVLFIQQEHSTYGNYIWRGQTKPWPLYSSLDRQLRDVGRVPADADYQEHAARFRAAMRGRRDPLPSPSGAELDDDFWAIGQHNGLKTPLLDWSESPFVAAFFAFEEEDSSTEHRYVYGLNHGAVEKRNREILNADPALQHVPLRVFRPTTGDNTRLLAQGGVFTRTPPGVDVENWVRSYFKGSSRFYRLIRLLVPTSDRGVALRGLHRMNINHKTLFPDVAGASRYCNMCLTVRHYERPQGLSQEPDPPLPLADLAPPAQMAPDSVGFELDAETLLSLLRTRSRLVVIEEAVAARLPMRRLPLEPSAFWRPSFAFEIALLRQVGILRTGDVDRFIDSFAEESLLAFLCEALRERPSFDAGGTLVLLAMLGLARCHPESEYLAKFYATQHSPPRSAELTATLTQLHSAAQLVSP